MKELAQPILETKRLYLRPLNMMDVKDVYDYAKRPNVGPSAGWEPHKNINETIKFIEYSLKKKTYGQPGVYAIEYNQNGKVIGTIEVHSYQGHKGEIGFVLHPDYWNQGLITEAAKAIIIYAFEFLSLKRLAYCHFPDNLASKRVCEKLGFVFEGVLRNKFLRYDGKVFDDVVYSITSEDYHNQKIPWMKIFKKDVFIDYETK